MKKIRLKDSTVIEIKFIFRRLEVKIVPPNGSTIEGVLDAKVMEKTVGQNLIRITATKNILIRRPLVNVFINGELLEDSDMHLNHVFKDFTFICILFALGNSFFSLNSYYAMSNNIYLLGFAKAFAFGWGDEPAVYLGGLVLGLTIFYFLRQKKHSGIRLICIALFLDSILSMYFGNPSIVIFAIILRLILFPNSIYAAYLLLKKFRKEQEEVIK